MGFFDFLKKKDKKTANWTNQLPKELVDSFLKKIEENTQATNTDFIKSGIGEYGLEKTNPIPTFGIPSNETYLQKLRTSNNEILRYRRTGGFEVDNINEVIDEYEIFNQKGDTIAFIYLSPYHRKTSNTPPVGFYIAGQKRKTYTPLPEDYIVPQSAYEEYLLIKKENVDTKVNLKKEGEKTEYREDYNQLLRLLKENGITKLYHFTDLANLESIRNHNGLRSWFYCLSNDIEIPIPGGNKLSRELDHRNGLHDYVRISFTRNHPMMFAQHNRDKNNVILEIDLKAICLKENLFANMNATKNGVAIGGSIDDFKKIKLDLFKHPNQFKVDEPDRAYYQAEVLIRQHLPLKYILNLKEFC